MTTHSLAYQNTINQFNLSVGFFGYKNIREQMHFEHKLILIDILNEFCLSKYHKFDDFTDIKKEDYALIKLPANIFDLAKSYLQKMFKGRIDITHAGYLKLYHILLQNKKITHKQFDMVALDEAGDLNSVTLEIFKLLPANQKIMVGDSKQNIYTFNGTINGFKEMEGKGLSLNLTKSFRCTPNIARLIESFCQNNLDPRMTFIGTEPVDNIIRSTAYLSRTNSSLIGKMIELNKTGTKYNLTRPAKNIFELLIILLSLKPKSTIYAKEWKFLQEDANEWNIDIALSSEFDSVRKYIAFKYKDDIAIGSALNVLGEYSSTEIFAAYENAKAHEKEKNHNVTLSTVSSSKG